MILPLSLGLPTTPFSVLFRGSIVVVSIVLILINLVKHDHLVFHKGFVFLFIFWLIYSLRLIYDLSISPIKIGPQLQSVNHIYLFAIGSTFIPLISLFGIRNRVSIRFAERAIFITSLIQVFSIIFIFFILYRLSLEAFFSRHLVTNLMKDADLGQPINPIIAGRSGGYLAIFSLVFRPKFKGAKLFSLLMFSVGFSLMVLGASRGPLAAFAGCIFFLIFHFLVNSRKTRKWFYTMFLGSMFTLIVTMFAVKYIAELDISLLDRTARTFDSSSQYRGTDRLETWSSAWDQFLSNPILGDQIVERKEHSYPHNLILEVLMSTGLVGFLPFILAIFYAFMTGYRFFKKGHKVIFILFLYGFFTMMFSGAIFLSPEFWVTFSLLFNVQES